MQRGAKQAVGKEPGPGEPGLTAARVRDSFFARGALPVLASLSSASGMTLLGCRSKWQSPASRLDCHVVLRAHGPRSPTWGIIMHGVGGTFSQKHLPESLGAHPCDGDRLLQLLIFNEEFLVSASHQLAQITSLPLVHTVHVSFFDASSLKPWWILRPRSSL